MRWARRQAAVAVADGHGAADDGGRGPQALHGGDLGSDDEHWVLDCILESAAQQQVCAAFRPMLQNGARSKKRAAPFSSNLIQGLGLGPAVASADHVQRRAPDSPQPRARGSLSLMRAIFCCVLQPSRGAAVSSLSGVHFGVICDGCERGPIVGIRYHKRGCDFDLCAVDWARLGPRQQAAYVAQRPLS